MSDSLCPKLNILKTELILSLPQTVPRLYLQSPRSTLSPSLPLNKEVVDHLEIQPLLLASIFL